MVEYRIEKNMLSDKLRTFKPGLQDNGLVKTLTRAAMAASGHTMRRPYTDAELRMGIIRFDGTASWSAKRVEREYGINDRTIKKYARELRVEHKLNPKGKNQWKDNQTLIDAVNGMTLNAVGPRKTLLPAECALIVQRNNLMGELGMPMNAREEGAYYSNLTTRMANRLRSDPNADPAEIKKLEDCKGSANYVRARKREASTMIPPDSTKPLSPESTKAKAVNTSLKRAEAMDKKVIETMFNKFADFTQEAYNQGILQNHPYTYMYTF